MLYQGFLTIFSSRYYKYILFSSFLFNRQILSKYFFSPNYFLTFQILSCFTFHMQETLDTMAQASAAQQRQEVERALRGAEQGAKFRSNFSHIFLLFQRNWFDVIFANFCFGQWTFGTTNLTKYILQKPICQTYLTHIRCHDQTWVLGLNFGNSCTKQVENFWSRQIHV